MENEVKGTRYDDGNVGRHCQRRCDNYLYFCQNDKHCTIRP